MALQATWPVASLEFTVEAVPVPLARPRFSAGHVYNPSGRDLRRFRDAAAPHCPFGDPPPGPLEVTLEFVMTRPRSHWRAGARSHELKPSAPATHMSTPDVDNLSKLVLDALNGQFYADDRQIWSLRATKRYGAAGERAATRVALRYGLDGVRTWQVAPIPPAAPPENNVVPTSN